MNPAIEERLRSHVAAILARAGVPSDARDDVREEMFGHLVERWRAHVAAGMDEVAAADHAIDDFGTPARVGRELGRTYHSRLWASTIGVLLPAVAPSGSRPGVVRWLRFVLLVSAILTALVVVLLPSMTPLPLLVSAAGASIVLATLSLAYRALNLGQRWALYYAVGTAVILLVLGIVDVVAPAQPGTLTIPLGSILAAGVLLATLEQWHDLQAYVAQSPRINWALGIALAALLGIPFVPRAMAALPDPTQANAEDLELQLSLACDRADVVLEDGPTLEDVRRATLTINATWARTDILPAGLVGLLAGDDTADTVGVRVLDPPQASWMWATGPATVDRQTGTPVGWWGSSSPSVGLLPEDVAGSFTVGISSDEMKPGRTIRMTWELITEDDSSPSPVVQALWAHLDRFVVSGRVGCGESVQGRRSYPAAGGVDSEPPPAPTIVDAGVVTDVRIGQDWVEYVLEEGPVRLNPSAYRQLTDDGWGGFGLVIIGFDEVGQFVATYPTQTGLPPDCYRENAVGIERGDYIEIGGVLWAKAPGFAAPDLPEVGSAYPMGTRFCFNDRGLISSILAR